MGGRKLGVCSEVPHSAFRMPSNDRGQIHGMLGRGDGVRWDHGVLRTIPVYGGAVPSGNGLWEMRTRKFGLPAWSLCRAGGLSIVGTGWRHQPGPQPPTVPGAPANYYSNSSLASLGGRARAWAARSWDVSPAGRWQGVVLGSLHARFPLGCVTTAVLNSTPGAYSESNRNSARSFPVRIRLPWCRKSECGAFLAKQMERQWQGSDN